MDTDSLKNFGYAERVSARVLEVDLEADFLEKAVPNCRQVLPAFSIPKQQFFSPRQVASLLLFSDQTVWRWLRNGKLPAIKVGRYYRIPLETLASLIKNPK